MSTVQDVASYAAICTVCHRWVNVCVLMETLAVAL